jgi:phage tail sheath protein FI
VTYQSPGVYIEEVPSGPQPIAAASTSVVAVIGALRKGPVMDPTRITGWSDFVRTFGPAHAGGFTAEALYGFFENGGPAAWVVRVDPSLSARWMVRDAGAATSFEITASSPGRWASDVGITITPDTTGGSASMFSATVTTAATIGGGAGVLVTVDQTAGIKVGDRVTVVKADGTAPANATVDAIDPGTPTTDKSLTLNKTGANLALAPFDRVAARIDTGTVTFTLASAKGIKPGDLLVAELAGGVRVSGLVQSVAPAGTGLSITLTTALTSAIPGIGLDDRFARFRASVAAPASPSVPLADVTFEGDVSLAPTTSTALAGGRATASNGRVGRFDSPSSAFVFAGPTPPPSGALEIEGRLRVVKFAETGISVANPTPADVLSRYGFLPDGTSITLTVGGSSARFTKAAGAFTTADATTFTFTSALFDLPTNASNGVVVRCAEAPRVGEYVRFGTANLRITAVDSPGGSVYVLRFAETTDISATAGGSFALRAFTPTRLAPQRFTLALTVKGAPVETFPGLALEPTHPQYYARDGVVNGVSTLITVAPRAAGAPAIAEGTMPAFAVVTQDGRDQAPTTGDYKNGLTALEGVPEPAILICPDTVTFDDPLLQADLVGAVVTHCETFRRFAVVDAPDLASDTDLLDWRNSTLSSTYAALYAPHLKMVTIDPESTDRFRTVPPSGFVAGVFARTDRERGVYKAPGNERVAGIVGLSQSYTQRRQDLLNPGAVNLIRAFPGRGTRIWGARNATDDVTWRYVNVRRLFNFVETSVENGTQWVVFEPNTASTWIRIKVSVENFLDQLWRSGALAGTSPEQAYRVRVGLGETMTETDIDLGLVVTEVAIAPAKPAEFVIFRFSHKRLSE